MSAAADEQKLRSFAFLNKCKPKEKSAPQNKNILVFILCALLDVGAFFFTPDYATISSNLYAGTLISTGLDIDVFYLCCVAYFKLFHAISVLYYKDLNIQLRVMSCCFVSFVPYEEEKYRNVFYRAMINKYPDRKLYIGCHVLLLLLPPLAVKILACLCVVLQVLSAWYQHGCGDVQIFKNAYNLNKPKLNNCTQKLFWNWMMSICGFDEMLPYVFLFPVTIIGNCGCGKIAFALQWICSYAIWLYARMFVPLWGFGVNFNQPVEPKTVAIVAVGMILEITETLRDRLLTYLHIKLWDASVVFLNKMFDQEPLEDMDDGKKLLAMLVAFRYHFELALLLVYLTQLLDLIEKVESKQITVEEFQARVTALTNAVSPPAADVADAA